MSHPIKQISYWIGISVFFVPTIAFLLRADQEITDIMSLLGMLAGTFLVAPLTFFGPIRRRPATQKKHVVKRRKWSPLLGVFITVGGISMGYFLGRVLGTIAFTLDPTLPGRFQSQVFLIGLCVILGFFYLVNYIMEYKRGAFSST